MTASRAQHIEAALRSALSPRRILVKDQSHLHAGHAGAEDGRGHFEVTVIADAFEGKNRLQRHRMVFEAVGSLMQTDVHALSINAYTSAERPAI
ncbi:MAG: BolA family protein [Pseudomonadota bacterium]